MKWNQTTASKNELRPKCYRIHNSAACPCHRIMITLKLPVAETTPIISNITLWMPCRIWWKQKKMSYCLLKISSSFILFSIGSDNSKILPFSDVTFKIHDQGHRRGQRSKSYTKQISQLIHTSFVSCQSDYSCVTHGQILIRSLPNQRKI